MTLHGLAGPEGQEATRCAAGNGPAAEAQGALGAGANCFVDAAADCFQWVS